MYEIKHNSAKLLKDLIGYTFVFTFVIPILPLAVLYAVNKH